MPTTFEIISAFGIVVVRHSGDITLAESEASFAEFQTHPDMRLGQHHVVDCREVESYERDFARFMAFQARMVSQFGADAPEFLLVLIGPHGVPQELANLIRKTWEPTPKVIPRVVSTEAEAMEILGLPVTRISDLIALAKKSELS